MSDKNVIVSKVRELFIRYGVRSLSMDDIAWRCSVSKNRLYDFFRNKEDLVLYTIRQDWEEWKASLMDIDMERGDPKELLNDIYYKRFALIWEVNPMFILESEKAYHEVAELYVQMNAEFCDTVVRPLLERAGREKKLREGVDIDFVCRFHQHLFETIFTSRQNLYSNVNMDKSFEHVFGHNLNGLFISS
ncbi:MAG TPA: hypothetical protein DDW81_13765 [Cryomorphaceae bacterium]|nr:hypothetical protein [Owenweeksia sp.]HBF21163.1 hypothetical protein [Cryomorphaceae bacterium]|tara:strand:- start:223 stop:792 length:570 start_codon:yes stop_codon:yes gene_type:complete